MQAVITQELVKSLKPEAKPYEVRDPRLKGFLLRVQPTGVMTYYAEYGRGKRHRIGPGRCPGAVAGARGGEARARRGGARRRSAGGAARGQGAHPAIVPG